MTLRAWSIPVTTDTATQRLASLPLKPGSMPTTSPPASEAAREGRRAPRAGPLADNPDVESGGHQRAAALRRRGIDGAASGRERPEGFPHHRPGPRRVHLIRALAGRGLGEDALRILPEAVLLELVLELDAEPAPEDGEIVVDGEGALRLEDAEIALAAVVDGGEGVGARGPGARDLVARHLVPHRGSHLLLHRRRAAPAEARIWLDARKAQAGYRLEEPLARAALALPGRAHVVIVERDRRVYRTAELDLRELRQEELSGVAHLEGKRGLSHLIVEVDAGGTPHHDLFGLVALEELDGVVGHAAGRRRVALLVVDDAAAVGGAAHRHVVESQAVEDGGDGVDHMRRPEDIAAEVENDPVALILRGRGGVPLHLARHVGEVAHDRDLVEITFVVVGHGVLLPMTEA